MVEKHEGTTLITFIFLLNVLNCNIIFVLFSLFPRPFINFILTYVRYFQITFKNHSATILMKIYCDRSTVSSMKFLISHNVKFSSCYVFFITRKHIINTRIRRIYITTQYKDGKFWKPIAFTWCMQDVNIKVGENIFFDFTRNIYFWYLCIPFIVSTFQL